MENQAQAETCNFIQVLTRFINDAMYSRDYLPRDMHIDFNGRIMDISVDGIHIAYDTERAELRPVWGELQLQLTREAILYDADALYGYEPEVPNAMQQ